jgi:hypothetical protein
MFRRVYIPRSEGKEKYFQEFNSFAEMKATSLLYIDDIDPNGILVGEFRDSDLLKYYNYEKPDAPPAEPKIYNDLTSLNPKNPVYTKKIGDKCLVSSESFNAMNSDGTKEKITILDDGIVELDNGVRMSIEMYNLAYSMEMAAITDEEAPPSVVSRVITKLVADCWYRSAKHQGIYDTIACEVQFDARVGYESLLSIWFGFIQVRENNQDVWKFNSIYMLSTISKDERKFGCNSFKDSDFERLAPIVGFKGCKDIMVLADKKDDFAIANKLGVKPCKYNSIFALCNDARKGIFI